MVVDEDSKKVAMNIVGELQDEIKAEREKRGETCPKCAGSGIMYVSKAGFLSQRKVKVELCDRCEGWGAVEKDNR